MRCQGFWAAGSLTIQQDAPKDAAYLFTTANVTEEGFGYSGSSLKTRPTVVVVSYLDIDLQDTAYEVVEDHDGIAKYGVVRKEFSAFACTSVVKLHASASGFCIPRSTKRRLSASPAA